MILEYGLFSLKSKVTRSPFWARFDHFHLKEDLLQDTADGDVFEEDAPIVDGILFECRVGDDDHGLMGHRVVASDPDDIRAHLVHKDLECSYLLEEDVGGPYLGIILLGQLRVQLVQNLPRGRDAAALVDLLPPSSIRSRLRHHVDSMSDEFIITSSRPDGTTGHGEHGRGREEVNY